MTEGREGVALDSPVAAAVVRGGVAAFAAVVTGGLVLGAARRMTAGWYLGCDLLVLAALVVVTVRTQTPDPGAHAGGGRPSAIAVGVWVAIVAFVIGHGISNSPYTAYDAISYHLYFPARWLEAHRLLIVPTPFSDEAQAYQPGNGELWFLWLMMPLHSDTLARIGQVPFYVIGAAAAYLIGLRCSVSRRHAAYAATLFLIAPPIVEQAVGANVDLIAAAMFVSALWLGLVAADSNRPRDWALWGCAAGLFAGTKYLAAVYAPLLVFIALLPKPRLRILWGVPGILALGAPWYIRNWVAAGSPLYPATLTIAGMTIGRGAYTHDAMLQSFMHTTSLRLLGVSLVHAFGTDFFLVLTPVLLAGIVGAVTRGRWWPASAIVMALAGVIALCWAAVGDNTDARFLLPAVALAPSIVPLAFGVDRRWNAVVHVWLIVGAVWILVGADRQIHLSLPWFMADWLPLRGVLDPRFALAFFLLAGAAAAACALASRVGRRTVVAIALVLICGGSMGVGAKRWCGEGLCEYVQIDDPHIRLSYRYAVAVLTANVRNANVAYTGSNLPYLLSGSRLANTVYYVNIDDHLSWRFDQYARAYQRGVLARPTSPLAQPSGVLMPARGPDAVRPRYERLAGDPDEWKMNLERERITYLFIDRLDAYEIDYQWHNADGFPIEDEWARRDPRAFRLTYSNPDVRIYAVSLPMTDRAR